MTHTKYKSTCTFNTFTAIGDYSRQRKWCSPSLWLGPTRLFYVPDVLAMYSRCYLLMIGRHREASRTCSPMHRRSFDQWCIGDVIRLFLTSGDIESAAKKFNARIEIFRGVFPRFYFELTYAMDRRSIAESSSIVRGCIPEAFAICCCSRGIAEASSIFYNQKANACTKLK